MAQRISRCKQQLRKVANGELRGWRPPHAHSIQSSIVFTTAIYSNCTTLTAGSQYFRTTFRKKKKKKLDLQGGWVGLCRNEEMLFQAVIKSGYELMSMEVRHRSVIYFCNYQAVQLCNAISESIKYIIYYLNY